MSISGPHKFELDDYVLKVDISRVDNRKDPKTTPSTLVFAGAISAADWADKLQAGQRAEQQIELRWGKNIASLAPSHIKNVLRQTASIDACFEADLRRRHSRSNEYWGADSESASPIRQLVSLGDEHHSFFYDVRLCRSDGKFVLVTLESRLPNSYDIVSEPWTDTGDILPLPNADSQFVYPYTLCVETPVCSDFLSPLLHWRWPRDCREENGQHEFGPKFSHSSDRSLSVCRVSFDVKPLVLPGATGYVYGARGSSIVRQSVLTHCNVQFLFESYFHIDVDFEPTNFTLRGFVGSRFFTSDDDLPYSRHGPQAYSYNPRNASTVNVLDFLDQLAFDNPNSLNVFKLNDHDHDHDHDSDVDVDVTSTQ
jgi:hypothetical protein